MLTRHTEKKIRIFVLSVHVTKKCSVHHCLLQKECKLFLLQKKALMSWGKVVREIVVRSMEITEFSSDDDGSTLAHFFLQKLTADALAF